MNLSKFAVLTGAALALSATAATADTAVALVGDKSLVMIDTVKLSVSKPVQVTGVDKLLGIDLRPSNKKLYGVGGDGTIVSIDPATGASEKVSKLDKMLPDGVTAIVDFNPAADKLRLMGSDGTNLRVDVESGKVTTDGALAFLPDDANTGKKPSVMAAAYSNAFGKPEKTAMYDIDAALGALIQQTKPNDGTLKTLGSLGMSGAKSVAFDIQTKADGSNTAWLVADNTLYTVSLENGAAKSVGKVAASGAIRDITLMP